MGAEGSPSKSSPALDDPQSREARRLIQEIGLCLPGSQVMLTGLMRGTHFLRKAAGNTVHEQDTEEMAEPWCERKIRGETPGGCGEDKKQQGTVSGRCAPRPVLLVPADPP